jgi:hypothetical protein
MPPTEPLAVFHLVGAGAFSDGLVQIARAPDEDRGFIMILDYDLRTKQMRGYREYPPLHPGARVRSGDGKKGAQIALIFTRFCLVTGLMKY